MYFYWRAGVAVIAIFCTVNAQSGTTPLFGTPPGPATTVPDVSGCVDFIIAFDTSCSITEFHQENARDMMKDVVDQIVKGPSSNFGNGLNDFRMGVVRFQHNVSLVLSLDQGIDATTIKASIDTITQDPKERCHTHTWEALNLVRDEFAKPRPDDRDAASKVLFLVYDGITYGDSGFKNKPKTMVEINDTKSDDIEVYVFQQDYLQKTPGQDPNIELNETQKDEFKDHRFQMANVTLTDVFKVMADQKYTKCGSIEPEPCLETPRNCSWVSVQSFKDSTKSWDELGQVTTWDMTNNYIFSKWNFGLKAGDLANGIFHVSFQPVSVASSFVKADPSANTITVSRPPADDAPVDDHATFNEEASFIEHLHLFRNKHVALESVAKPDWYICEETGGDLVLHQRDDSAEFKDCASFLYTILR